PTELLLHRLRGQTQALARALHHRAAWRGLAAHEDRNPDDALVAHDGDLGGGAVLHDIEQRYDGCRREIDVALSPTRFVEYLSQGHFHRFELRMPSPPLRVGQRGQKRIASRIVDSGHIPPKARSPSRSRAS